MAVECPDGGFCHHECESACYRVRCCGPMGRGEAGWTYDEQEAHDALDRRFGDIRPQAMEWLLDSTRIFGASMGAAGRAVIRAVALQVGVDTDELARYVEKLRLERYNATVAEIYREDP